MLPNLSALRDGSAQAFDGLWGKVVGRGHVVPRFITLRVVVATIAQVGLSVVLGWMYLRVKQVQVPPPTTTPESVGMMLLLGLALASTTLAFLLRNRNADTAKGALLTIAVLAWLAASLLAWWAQGQAGVVYLAVVFAVIVAVGNTWLVRQAKRTEYGTSDEATADEIARLSDELAAARSVNEQWRAAVEQRDHNLRKQSEALRVQEAELAALRAEHAQCQLVEAAGEEPDDMGDSTLEFDPFGAGVFEGELVGGAAAPEGKPGQWGSG